VVDDHVKQNVHFAIECHGVVPGPDDAPQSVCVSSHWIRSCLEVCLTDIYIYIYTRLSLSTSTTGFMRIKSLDLVLFRDMLD
jgi:topoisomerase (DNA) II binding protein 1